MAKVVITCYTNDKDGVITNVGYDFIITLDGKETKVSNKRTKSDLISIIKKGNYPVTTSKGTEVKIVKDKYLRTKADKDEDNDLLDCPKCV